MYIYIYSPVKAKYQSVLKVFLGCLVSLSFGLTDILLVSGKEFLNFNLCSSDCHVFFVVCLFVCLLFSEVGLFWINWYCSLVAPTYFLHFPHSYWKILSLVLNSYMIFEWWNHWIVKIYIENYLCPPHKLFFVLVETEKVRTNTGS